MDEIINNMNSLTTGHFGDYEWTNEITGNEQPIYSFKDYNVTCTFVELIGDLSKNDPIYTRINWADDVIVLFYAFTKSSSSVFTKDVTTSLFKDCDKSEHLLYIDRLVSRRHFVKSVFNTVIRDLRIGGHVNSDFKILTTEEL
jgi:hypothetical protein